MPSDRRSLVAVAAIAAVLGGGVGAGVAALLEDEGPRGPAGPRGRPGPPAAPIIGDVGVIEARLGELDRRVRALERRLGAP